MAPRAVLLDIDGTLLLSNQAHARAWHEALAEQGVDVPTERLCRLIGMGGDQLLARIGLSDQHGPGKAATDRRKVIFRERFLPHLAPAPGARALLCRLADEGIDRIVVTSASSEEVDALLERAGVRDLVPRTTDADDVEASKPAPDAVCAALQALGRLAGEVVMLGDTPYDLAAATAAGVGMIAVRCGGWTFEDGGPLAVYDDPADLLDRWEDSPLRSSRVSG